MAIIEKTEYTVRCSRDTCSNYRRIVQSHEDAVEVEKRHKGFHRRWSVDAAVVAPAGGIGNFRERGRIVTIWWDDESVVVRFDRKIECHECVHPHQKVRTARVKMVDLRVPKGGDE